MKRLFPYSKPTPATANRRRNRSNPAPVKTRLWLLLLCGVLILGLGMSATLVSAQSESGIQEQEDQLIREYTLPSAPTKTPVYKPLPASPPKKSSPPSTPKQTAPAPARQRTQSAPPKRTPAAPATEAPATARPSTAEPERPSRPAPEAAEETTATEDLPTGEYVLQFNRSPVVGNRFRMRGVYSEARLGFTRPRGWKVQSAKALLRFQHSPALIASRSNLTVQVNGTSIGSVPLNRQQSQVGSVLFEVPSRLIQDYNELVIVARQNNDPECSDSGDPTLWTEVLPDSELQFEYQPQAIPLNFSRYPYPFFDDLSLDTNRMTYLLPTANETWLTAASRFQAALGRMAEFRPIETRLVQDIEETEWGERLVIIGTPAEQPALEDLDLPFTIVENQILDGNKAALPGDVGVLMMTTTLDGAVPVLVVTGNSPEGVAKAAQFLVQPDTRKFGTGQAVLVDTLPEVKSPPPRQWTDYLPIGNSFKLSEIKTQEDGKPLQDITVRGSASPPIEIDFHALPDDQFTRGSSMNLRYSYGPQVNPRTSAIEVLLDGVFIGGARLTSEKGARNKSLKVDLPADLITPTSKLEVAFRLNPREPGVCGKVTDQQLTGTLHADTSFDLNRQQSVQLPDLELLQSGFPFAAPQDLSKTAIVVPESPTDTDLLTMLAFSERLGRLSKSKSIQLSAYTTTTLPPEVLKDEHLVGIGTREQFPFPDVLQSGGFRLRDAFARQWGQGSIQTLPDNEGLIKEIVSPNNGERVLLALSSQTETGLERVRQILLRDPWFFQLQKDTALISSNQQDTASYDPDAYKIEFLERAPATRRIENTSLLGKASRFIQDNWFFLPAGVFAIAILLYGISQLYLKRLSDQKSH
ncbi:MULTISPECIES: cellulose biosynthesis cyclic di-GMP-binding regulatory protein BcsB [unclassified Coleofasciculus]|uniref:cellulose biosynthesis cyclic di-GMP-binding regulatory protein BcsB n=1 Tax=unclassified Coleofasciculus TaxID=2692782 RepID=UPI00187EB3DC|nr:MULTISPECIES: cellulose biosynthesis cyclic di-GMP-binding regulatory protein BcsB [unclassified Coleofasciculus]MBE9126573.1 cellulose biosynthesis cyclic di-GMP-binding regulatory protein BcsB [Coleofasciculus sp. LEGE 07081]MBE9149946.1 cellulose biosynthesis cyclic di-GMP-binding regulatory protein BcsB [Coleofasciculus sp. LEGE 07092]